MGWQRGVFLAFLALPVSARAQSEFATPDGMRVPGAVIECATNSPTVAAPCGTVSSPLKVDQGSAPSAAPNGGNGVIGFLAGIYNVLSSGLTIAGNVAVSNLPATQPVSGSVAINNLPVTQPVSGSVAINNLPAVQPVSGSMAINNLPSTQTVSGSVTATGPLTSFVDCSVSIPSAGGVVQVLASGTTRKSVVIQNVSSQNAGISLTNSAPSLGASQTFTLTPLASFITPANLVFSGPVYAVGTVAGQVLACTVFQ